MTSSRILSIAGLVMALTATTTIGQAPCSADMFAPSGSSSWGSAIAADDDVSNEVVVGDVGAESASLPPLGQSTPLGLLPGDEFGEAVAVGAVDGSDRVYLVGAPGTDDGAALDCGRVHVALRDAGGTVTWDVIDPPSPLADARFGATVGADGDLLAIGAPGEGSGAVYVYRFDPNFGTYAFVIRLDDATGSAGDGFGAAVAVTEMPNVDQTARIVIGVPGSGAGRIEIHVEEAGAWDLEFTISAPAGVTESFGAKVSAARDVIVAGAPDDDANGVDAGSAHLFERDLSPIFLFTGYDLIIVGYEADWDDSTQLVDDAPVAGAQFGAAVAARDDAAIVGRPSGINGEATIFRSTATGWIETSSFVGPNGFGSSLACNTRRLYIGSPVEQRVEVVETAATIVSETGGIAGTDGKPVVDLVRPAAFDVATEVVLTSSHSDPGLAILVIGLQCQNMSVGIGALRSRLPSTR